MHIAVHAIRDIAELASLGAFLVMIALPPARSARDPRGIVGRPCVARLRLRRGDAAAKSRR